MESSRKGYQAVADGVALAAGGDNSQVGQALHLVGHGLGLYADGGRKIGHTQLLGADEGVQNTQPWAISQNLKDRSQTTYLDRR